jgi:drug/metabolite transporter (DMT)-like permease
MRRLLAFDARAGITLALITAIISGVSVYLNKSAVQGLPNPLVFTTLKNTLVGLVLLLWLAAAWRPAGFRLTRRTAIALGGLAAFGGSLPFLLFFQGLATASAPSAALIHKSLFLWVALLAAGLLHERPGRWTVTGLVLLAAGQLVSGWPKAWGWASGESMILAATLLWTIETVLARRLLPNIPTAIGATARMAGGAAIMWAYLFTSGQAAGAWTLSATQWGWLIVTSILLFGYVTTWYAALKRAPATSVTSVLVLGAVITVGLAATAGGQSPSAKDLIGLVIIAAGVVLSIWTGRRSRHVQLATA